MLLLVLGSSGAARATDDSVKAAVRALADEAKRDFEAGSYEQARQKFQRAYDAAKVPRLAVWTARSSVELGKLVRASELYREATLLAPNDLWIGNLQQQAQAEARTGLAALLPRIPTLRIRVEGALVDSVAVMVDGVTISPALFGLGIPCDPGLRRVLGRRNSETVEQTIHLAEGRTQEVVLRFPAVVGVASPIPTPPAPPPYVAPPSPAWPAPSPAWPAPSPAWPTPAPPPTGLAPSAPTPSFPVPGTETPAPGATGSALTGQGEVTLVHPTPSTERPAPTGSARRTWGYIVLGVGTVGLLTGIGTGIALASSNLRGQCPNNTCDPTRTSSSYVTNYNAMRTISTVGFIAGGVGVAAGLTLLLWPAPNPTGTKAAIWIGPSSAGLAGRF
jgi:hypothetical protein